MIPCCCEYLLSAAFTPWLREPQSWEDWHCLHPGTFPRTEGVAHEWELTWYSSCWFTMTMKAGMRGCCPVRHSGSQSLRDEGRIRYSLWRKGNRGDPQEDRSNLVVEWAGVSLETWWSSHGILFSGKARSSDEASCRNKYKFALAGFSLRSWSGSWPVSLMTLEIGERAHKTQKNYKKLPKYIWNA